MLELLSALVKALSYAAALSGAGSVLARATLLRGMQSPPDLNTLIRMTGAGLALCVCGSFLLLVLRLGVGLDPATLGAVFLSPLGAALALQFAGGLWLIATAGRRSAIIAALLILPAFGVVGHSASHGLMASSSVVLHVTAAAWWLGGLWTLLLASQLLAPDAFAAVVSRFSRQAIQVVAVLIMGALLTAALLLEFRVDPASHYDRGLLAKGGLTLLLLVLAGFNRLILSPGLATGQRSVGWLRCTIAAELILFACIVSVTTWLTTWQSPP